MDTQFFDGAEHRYTDYPITDILQAGWPSFPLLGRLFSFTSSRSRSPLSCTLNYLLLLFSALPRLAASLPLPSSTN
eukprot:5640518-Pleurochrysis_carterae.AAC.4